MFRDALLDQMDPQQKKMSVPGLQPSVGGIQPNLGGGFAPTDPTEMPVGPTTPPAQKFGLSGYDAGKLADPSHKTEKYQIGRVQEQFDPSAGITPEFLAALNGLDIGDFSGSGDRLSVKNSRNGSRFTDGTGDVIQNYTGDGPKQWTFLDTSEPGAAPSEGGGGMAMPQAMPNLQDLFSGGGQGQIAQGVEQYSQPSKYLEALLAQLGAQ